MKEYMTCLKKYTVFAGRARRREYWLFVLFNIIVGFALGVVLGFVSALTKTTELLYLSQVYTLAVILPGISVFVRRMHDTGRSGWWFWLGLVPVVGPIVLLVFCCLDSQPGDNAYGPNPKA